MAILDKIKSRIKGVKTDKEVKIETVSKHFVEDTVSKIVSRYKKSVIRHVMPALMVHGRKKEVTLLFLSLKNISLIDEVLGTIQSNKFLEKYLKDIIAKIESYGGVVHVMGTNILAFFNVLLQNQHRIAAVKCALIIKEINENYESELKKYNLNLDVGIGIHTDEVLSVLSDNIFKYNSSGYLLRIAKDLSVRSRNSQILISSNLYKKVQDDIKSKRIGFINYEDLAEEVFIVEGMSIKDKFKPYMDRVNEVFGTKEVEEKKIEPRKTPKYDEDEIDSLIMPKKEEKKSPSYASKELNDLLNSSD